MELSILEVVFSMKNSKFGLGEEHLGSKVTEEIVKHVRELRLQRVKYKIISSMYGISLQAICDIVKMRTWKHVE